MPITHRTPRHQPLRRDSWPPTQIPIYPSIEADDDDKMDMDHLDDNPLNSYLSPRPLLDDGDTDDEMDMDLEMNMAFDAGIEDSSRPMPIIRNISPSKLSSGLRPPPPRTPTPPRYRFTSHSPPSRNSPEISTPISTDTDDYDDGEDYVRLSPSPSHPGSFRLAAPPAFTFTPDNKGRGMSGKSAAIAAAKAEEKEQDRVALMMARGSSYTEDDDHLSLSPSFHVGRPKMAPQRGRSTRPAPLPLLRPSLAPRPRSWAGGVGGGYGSGRLSPRAWREPSPDVWSIEEEEEAEISDMDLDAPVKERKGKGKGKRVRFALPVREDIP